MPNNSGNNSKDKKKKLFAGSIDVWSFYEDGEPGEWFIIMWIIIACIIAILVIGVLVKFSKQRNRTNTKQPVKSTLESVSGAPENSSKSVTPISESLASSDHK